MCLFEADKSFTSLFQYLIEFFNISSLSLLFITSIIDSYGYTFIYYTSKQVNRNGDIQVHVHTCRAPNFAQNLTTFAWKKGEQLM